MNIVYLAAYFYPEKYSSNNIYNAILSEMAKNNTVHVITPQPTRGISETEYNNYKSIEVIDNIIIHRFPMEQEKNQTIKRFLRYQKCNSCYRELIQTIGNIDCIFAASTPPTMGLIAGKIASELHIPFVYSLQDVFPDSLITTGLIKSKKNIFWKIGRFLENRIYKKCNHIIAVSGDFKNNLLAKHVPENKISVVHNFVDMECCNPVNRKNNKLFEEFELDRNKFYVTYAGNFGKAQNLEVLLHAAHLMQDKSDVEFILIGDGAEENNLKKLAANLNLNNVRFFPMQPNERISEIYSLGDVSIVICRKGSGKSAMPSKTWNIMACAAPVIASFDKDTDMERILQESKGGLFVESGTPQELANAIDSLKNNNKLCEEMGLCGNQYIAENLAKQVSVLKYIQILESVVEKDKSAKQSLAKMDIACLMGLFPHEYQKEILDHSISGVQNAANKLQWNIVEGLDSNLDKPVKIFNSLYIGSYPRKYTLSRIPTFTFHHTENAEDINIGFNNRAIIKYLSKYVGIKKEIKKWVDDVEKDKVLIVYAMTSPFMQLISYIKKRNKNITICLIVPDLPDYMNQTLSTNFLYTCAKKMQNFVFYHCIKSVDCFVLLTEHMKHWFKTDIQYTVVEGIASTIINTDDDYKKRKSILYSGMIEKKYGVVDLVKSFIKLDNSEWTLDIYGDGTAVDEILDILKENGSNNVILYGSVPNSEVVTAQKNASVLVNPRRNLEVFTKYSFPSKIIEYMSSGTPVVAYALDGMPCEYLQYFYNVPETDEGLYLTLKNVISLSDEERRTFGEKARKFVSDNKNAKSQCKKIIDLIEECNCE